MPRANSDHMVPVVLANERMEDDPQSVGMIKVYVDQQPTYAQIEPISMTPFLLGQQMDINAPTHIAYLRWEDYANFNYFSFILRERLRPDQSTFTEVYRVHRVKDEGGLSWYVSVEIELQKHIPSC